MTAYYNEHDKYCARWLRNLVAAGLIAPGDVDDRDVRDVRPADLRGYAQVHLFAGIGLWSHALRMAGWGDDRPVWTASCPCQPFSQAGGGGGVFDDRHLWPAAHWLIGNLRPGTVFGEQVASPDGVAWLDIVCADLGACGYSVGAVDFPSAGVGAPNIRQRLYWVADTGGQRRPEAGPDQSAPGHEVPRGDGSTGGLADATEARFGGRQDRGTTGSHAGADGRGRGEPERDGSTGWLADTDGEGVGGRRDDRSGQGAGARDGRALQRPAGLRATGSGLGNASGAGRSQQLRNGDQQSGARLGRDQSADAGFADRLGNAQSAGLPDASPSVVSGTRRWREGGEPQPSGGAANPWRNAEWVYCRDHKYRPFESGSFPLAPRHSGDVAKLRAYGNAINPFVAEQVIRAFMSLSTKVE